MLTFPEEILLLALDDDKGVIKDMPRVTVDTALAAAALLELSFLNKLDAGPKNLFISDTTPVGDPLLDEVLEELKKIQEDKPILYWLNLLTESLTDLEEKVLSGLVKKNVLKVENRKILWVFHQRRYPVVNNLEITEVKQRLRELVRMGELPEPRDIVLISLVTACHLWREIFDGDECEKYQDYIEKMSKLDFMGQALAESIRGIEQTIFLMNEALYQYT